MKTETTKTVEIHLTLRETEAIWLKDYIQNYFGDIEEEDPVHRVYRYDLFNELKQALGQ